MRNGLTIPPTPVPFNKEASTSVSQNGLQSGPGAGDSDAHMEVPADAFDLPLDLTTEMDDWLAQPFDPSFAPFGIDLNQTTSGFDMNSLDFLWNLPA